MGQVAIHAGENGVFSSRAELIEDQHQIGSRSGHFGQAW